MRKLCLPSASSACWRGTCSPCVLGLVSQGAPSRCPACPAAHPAPAAANMSAVECLPLPSLLPLLLLRSPLLGKPPPLPHPGASAASSDVVSISTPLPLLMTCRSTVARLPKAPAAYELAFTVLLLQWEEHPIWDVDADVKDMSGHLKGGKVLFDCLGSRCNLLRALQELQKQPAATFITQCLQAVTQRAQALLSSSVPGHVPRVRGIHIQRRQRESVRGCSIPQQCSDSVNFHAANHPVAADTGR